MKHINNLLKARPSPLDVGSGSLPNCRYPECTAYKPEGGNHQRQKPPFQLPTRARGLRTTGKRFLKMSKGTVFFDTRLYIVF